MRIAASALRASSQRQAYSVIPRRPNGPTWESVLFYDGRGGGPPYLGHGLRRPNFVPKFGASVKSSAPTKRRDSCRNHPSQRRAAKRPRPRPRGMGGNRRKDHPKRGTAPATAGAALSEAESAEIVAGQIQVLPDTLKVQHGVQGPEVSAKPRPCSRRGCVN